jgi:hypothetical protein
MFVTFSSHRSADGLHMAEGRGGTKAHQPCCCTLTRVTLAVASRPWGTWTAPMTLGLIAWTRTQIEWLTLRWQVRPTHGQQSVASSGCSRSWPSSCTCEAKNPCQQKGNPYNYRSCSKVVLEWLLMFMFTCGFGFRLPLTKTFGNSWATAYLFPT